MKNLSPNTLGALFMVGSMALFTLNDTAMKAVGANLPMFQALFMRGTLAAVLMFLAVWRLGQLRTALTPRDKWLVIARSAMDALAAFFFFTALFNMKLASLSAILQTLPLTVTLAGAVFLGEKVGWRRMGAIIIGFIGVLLIIKPGAESFNIYSVYGLLTVVVVTARDILSRKISAAVPTFYVALANAVAIMIFGGFASTFTPWSPVGIYELSLLIMAAFLIVGAYFCAVATMRVGEIAVVTPFRYTSLLFALILGLIVFGEWPDNLTIIGSLIVVATGLFTLWREGRVKKQGQSNA